MLGFRLFFSLESSTKYLDWANVGLLMICDFGVDMLND
jgi:hypothetical protein